MAIRRFQLVLLRGGRNAEEILADGYHRIMQICSLLIPSQRTSVVSDLVKMDLHGALRRQASDAPLALKSCRLIICIPQIRISLENCNFTRILTRYLQMLRRSS